MSTVNLFLAALKGVLRELPDGASGFRVEPGPSGYVTVQLMGPHGPLVACTVAQRVAPRNASRQLTIDDALAARQDVRAAAAAPPAPPAPAADTPPEPAAASPATVADDRGAAQPVYAVGPRVGRPIFSTLAQDDDRGADLGEDGREYPDGEPYAELRVLRGDWLHYRRALGDVVGGAHHGDWRPDGDHRTLVVSRSQLDRIRAALGVHAHFLGVTLLAENLRTGQLWVSASEWKSLSPEARDELANHVQGAWRREGDWYTATPYEDAAGYVYDRLCREGVAVHLEPPPEPTKTMKPAKGKLFRGQWHALDRSHAHPNTAYLAGPGSEGMERPRGLDDAAWRALVAQTVAGAPGATWRLYSAKGKCLWDSRDGGAP